MAANARERDAPVLASARACILAMPSEPMALMTRATMTSTRENPPLRARDDRDRNRAQSPLRPAADAIILDSTSMSLDEVLARSEELVRGYLSSVSGAKTV